MGMYLLFFFKGDIVNVSFNKSVKIQEYMQILK